MKEKSRYWLIYRAIHNLDTNALLTAFFKKDIGMLQLASGLQRIMDSVAANKLKEENRREGAEQE